MLWEFGCTLKEPFSHPQNMCGGGVEGVRETERDFYYITITMAGSNSLCGPTTFIFINTEFINTVDQVTYCGDSVLN